MAITKLLHQKECKKSSGRHLKNAIAYILNPEKTKEQLLVGSNCGTSAAEIYQTMLATKREFQKEKGRQGYHFIISFAKGEANTEKAYQIGQEFCERYLRDQYDYVYAVHDDKEHMHIHIIFNSVSYGGNKYHYAPGDWIKSVQPVTDALCVKYGLSKMLFEGEKKGMSYAQWNAKKQGKITNRELIRRDIDLALSKSATYEMFFQTMQEYGYKIRQGISKKYGEYLAFTPPGSEKAYRSYGLGKMYAPESLKKRISLPQTFSNPAPKMKYFRNAGGAGFRHRQLSSYQKQVLARYYHAGISYPKRKSSYYKKRKEIFAVSRLYEQCVYLLKNHITSREGALQRENELRFLKLL